MNCLARLQHRSSVIAIGIIDLMTYRKRTAWLVMAQEWEDLQAQIQAEMLMYAHYVEINWSYVHQKSSQLGILVGHKSESKGILKQPAPSD